MALSVVSWALECIGVSQGTLEGKNLPPTLSGKVTASTLDNSPVLTNGEPFT